MNLVPSWEARHAPGNAYPVIPSGAQAASAGALITMAAHVAAMAPGTTIGAATPVDLQGGEISNKVINDAASFAEAVAAQRGRSRQFAVQAVREGRSVTAEQAQQLGVVDLLAPDRDGLLRALNGRQARLAPDLTVTLHTADARTVEHGMASLRSLLQRLADPNLAFLLLSIGTLALIYELASPGMGLDGVLRTIMLVLGFAALSVRPVGLAGLLLGLAAALFVGEVLTPGGWGCSPPEAAPTYRIPTAPGRDLPLLPRTPRSPDQPSGIRGQRRGQREPCRTMHKLALPHAS